MMNRQVKNGEDLFRLHGFEYGLGIDPIQPEGHGRSEYVGPQAVSRDISASHPPHADYVHAKILTRWLHCHPSERVDVNRLSQYAVETGVAANLKYRQDRMDVEPRLDRRVINDPSVVPCRTGKSRM